MSAPTFDLAASRVLTRVLLRRGLRLLARSASWIMGLLAATAIARFFFDLGLWLPLSILALWIIIVAALVWRTRPDRYAALAFWDETRQRSEAFAAAWWFTQQRELTGAQQQHVTSQQAQLPAALDALARDLPLQPARSLIAVAGVLLLASAITALRPLPAGDQHLTDAMRDAAAREGRKLADNTLATKKLTGLTDEEKRALEKLKQDVQQTARSIEEGKAESARGVLSDLEKRARDAEKLAQKLGTDRENWASDQLIAALRSHADTADLGDAAASKNTAQTAAAAQALAQQLKQPQLPAEVRDRLDATLQDATKASETPDRQRVVGSHVIAASEALQKADAQAAAQQFEELARKMQDAQRREQAQRELEKLAQQLRDAGSRIAGQQKGGMEKMQQAGQSGAQGSSQETAQQSAQVPQQLQPPGIGQPSAQDLSQMQNAANPSGQQQQSQQSMSLAQQGDAQRGQSGQRGDKDGSPVLIAPIPGSKPLDKPNSLLIAPSPPNDAPPQGSITQSGSGPKAGSGTAKLDNAPTVPQKAGKSSVVDARPTGEGPSSVRSIEGGVRQEAAQRNAATAPADFIKEQEAALDDSALPASRREQVRRYFGELRKRFEQK